MGYPGLARAPVSRARVRPVVDAAETGRVHVAVHLGRRERAVPEQLLDRPQVGAALEEVGRERVPQAVRVREEPAQRARVEPASAGGEEERVLGAAGELRPCLAKVDGEPVRSLLAERDDPLLVAFPAHVDELLLEVDVREIQVDGFLRAKSGRVDELEERAVPHGKWRGPLEGRELAVDLLRSRCVGQPPRASWRKGGVGHALRPERMTKEGAHRGELAANRRRGELPRPRAAELGRIVGEHAHVHVVEPSPAPLEPATELAYVHAVGAPRRLRQRRAREEPLNLPGHGDDFRRRGRDAYATAATISSLRLGNFWRNSARSALKRSTSDLYWSSRPCSA